MRRLLASCWPLLLFLFFTLIFFWKIVFAGLVEMHMDMIALYAPYLSYTAEALRGLRFPLWNPYLYVGVPHLANIQTGVFYPPNLLWLLLPTTTAFTVFLVSHVLFAGLSSYLFAWRAIGLSQFGATIAGLVFMFSGAFMGHAGHVVVVAPMAWMPLVLLAFHNSIYRPNLQNIILAGTALAMQVLGGHPQTPYYTLIVLSLYVAFLVLWGKPHRGWLRMGTTAALGIVTAVAFCAVQLLPTIELAARSHRSARSFIAGANLWALQPEKLGLALLPQLTTPAPEEWASYVGISGLLLCLLALVFGFRTGRVWFFFAISILALLLSVGSRTALYDLLLRYFPGFSSFRVPARWLIVYTLCMAMLAGIGADALARVLTKATRKRYASLSVALRVLVVLLATGELYMAAQSLPVSHPGPASTYSESGPALDFLASRVGNYRVLSVASNELVIYDEAARRQQFGGILDPKALEDYLDLVRIRLGLRANTLMASRIHSVNGSDGGLLPTSEYASLEANLFSRREALTYFPLEAELQSTLTPRLLSLVGVKYVVTEPRIPLVVDGIPFGLTRSVNMERLGLNLVEIRPQRPPVADAIAIVSTLSDAAQIEQGDIIANLEIATGDGKKAVVPLRAGIETAEWSLGSSVGPDKAAHRPVRVVSRKWMGRDDVSLYFAKLPLPQSAQISAVRLSYVHQYGRLHVLGLTSIDGGSGAAQELALSGMEEVYRGEVSILENPNVLPRAYTVHHVDVVEDTESAYKMMKDPTFDPSQSAVIGKPLPAQVEPPGLQSDDVAIVSYEPERVEIQARLGSTGLLVLTDAYYPGWKVTVDGKEREIYRANGIFRSVPLEPGDHTVVFAYAPASFYAGLLITILSIGVALTLLFAPRLKSLKSGRLLTKR